MQVTNIRVSFMREKQPVQYEKAQPLVEFAAVLEDHETDHLSAARSLMLDAASVVYAGIGYDVPEKVAQALANGQVPAQATATVEVKEAVPAAPEAPVEAESEVSDGDATEVPDDDTTDEKKPKPRGRPKGSKNTQPKAGTKAAKEQAEATAKAAEDDGIPDDDAPNIRANPEDRVDPNDDGIPGDDDDVPVTQEPLPSGETEVATDDSDVPSGEAEQRTARELHAFTMKKIQEKKINGPDVKQILAPYKVARFGDVSADKVEEIWAIVEKAIAARAK